MTCVTIFNKQGPLRTRSRSNKLIGSLIRIKIPFVENSKQCTISAILRENILFYLAATEAKTCCVMLRRGPKIMQIPLGDHKTIFIAWKFCDFVGKVEISLYSQNHFGAMLIRFGDTCLVDTVLGKN